MFFAALSYQVGRWVRSSDVDTFFFKVKVEVGVGLSTVVVE